MARGKALGAVRGSQIANVVRAGVRDDNRVNVRRVVADRREVIEDAAAIRAHGPAGSGLDQNPPTAGFDQQCIEVERHVVGGQKCLPQDLLKLGFRRVACVDARRTTNHAVTQHVALISPTRKR